MGRSSQASAPLGKRCNCVNRDVPLKVANGRNGRVHFPRNDPTKMHTVDGSVFSSETFQEKEAFSCWLLQYLQCLEQFLGLTQCYTHSFNK